MNVPGSPLQNKCNTAIGAIGQISLVLCAISLLLLTAMFTATILGRFAGINIPASDDISVILLAGSFALGFAFVMAENDHLSVDLIIGRLNGTGGTVARFVILVFVIIVVSLMNWGLWHMFQTAIRNGITMPSALPIPRALPIGVVLVGTALFEIVMILRLIERAAAGTYPQPVKILEIDQ